MQLPRRKQREILLQLLFSWEVSESSSVELMMQSLEVSKKHILETEGKLQKILEQVKTIDEILVRSSHSYALDRISLVDKNILRLALFELVFEQGEVKIVIDEALRLSKKFSSPEAVSYVHAIIDEVNKNERVPV